MLSNYQINKISGTVKRLLVESCTGYFISSVTKILLMSDYTDLVRSQTPRTFLMVVKNPEHQTTTGEIVIPEDVYRNVILGNSSYSVFRDRNWDYIMASSEEDLNLLRIASPTGICTIMNLQEINKIIGA